MVNCIWTPNTKKWHKLDKRSNIYTCKKSNGYLSTVEAWTGEESNFLGPLRRKCRGHTVTHLLKIQKSTYQSILHSHPWIIWQKSLHFLLISSETFDVGSNSEGGTWRGQRTSKFIFCSRLRRTFQHSAARNATWNWTLKLIRKFWHEYYLITCLRPTSCSLRLHIKFSSKLEILMHVWHNGFNEWIAQGWDSTRCGQITILLFLVMTGSLP